MDSSSAPISEIIHNGIIFDLKNWGKQTMNGDDLAATVERLFALLHE